MESFYQGGIIRASDINEQTFQNVSAGQEIKISHATNVNTQQYQWITTNDFPVPYTYLIRDGVLQSGYDFYAPATCAHIDPYGWTHGGYIPDYTPSTVNGAYRLLLLGNVSAIPVAWINRYQIDFTNVKQISMTFYTSDFSRYGIRQYMDDNGNKWYAEDYQNGAVPVQRYGISIFNSIEKYNTDNGERVKNTCFWEDAIAKTNIGNSTRTSATTITIDTSGITGNKYFSLNGSSHTSGGGLNFYGWYVYVTDLKLIPS